MGRYSTGSVTTSEAIRIELSYLLKHGYIKKGQIIYATLNWTNGSNISIQSNFTVDCPYIRLIYNNTNYCTGEVTEHDYKIYFTSIPSNLGKGEVVYFLCPDTFHMCRILYKCYGSPIWKSRYAYLHRIYYQSQISSKLHYYIDRYWETERQLEQLYSRVVKSHYKGRKSALQKRIERLEDKQEYYDHMRWRILPKSIQKLIYPLGLQSAEALF